jgi:hypothetical protein
MAAMAEKHELAIGLLAELSGPLNVPGRSLAFDRFWLGRVPNFQLPSTATALRLAPGSFGFADPRPRRVHFISAQIRIFEKFKSIGGVALCISNAHEQRTTCSLRRESCSYSLAYTAIGRDL